MNICFLQRSHPRLALPLLLSACFLTAAARPALSNRARRLGRLRLMLGAALAGVAGFSSGTAEQTLTTLHSFTGGDDGANPVASLIADAAGNLYGTTPYGGASGYGTVFALTPSGTETVLHSFTGGDDGGYPAAGLIADASGNLYGTTGFGGDAGYGTVFRVTQSGTETVLHSFTNADGAYPLAGLIADAAGNLYGTTEGGGANGYGTVFKLTPSGTETVLHSFTNADGAFPLAGLIADADANLYGTTNNGGASGYGTVFKVTPSGIETVLHSFTGGADGGYPFATLIADVAGNLYGTTSNGGASGYGVVFALTPSGAETVLHSFTGSDGGYPKAGLIADAAGNLYGTTNYGGANVYYGTVFELTASGTETVLYSFTSGGDGANPSAALVADAAGNLYGTTMNAGASGYGTVFKLNLQAHFAGVPGQPNCFGQSVSFLARQYGGIAHAAASLGHSSVADLQNAVRAYCGG
jgi:uncharacterized repeat protein (TIGR03803 family)